MKKSTARFLSMVLAVIMLVSVLPLNVLAVSKKEDPAFNVYKANVFANGDIGFYKDNVFSYEHIFNPTNVSFQRTYYELLKSNNWFMGQVVVWEILHDLEKPSHASESGMVSLLDYYESALFDLILNYEDEESSENKNSSLTVDTVGGKLFQTVNNSQIKYMSSIAKTILKNADDGEVVLSIKKDSLVDIFKHSLDKSTKDKIEEYVIDNKSNSGIVDFNDALDFIDKANTVFDAIMTASKYCAIKDFCDGTKEVLEYIANDNNNSATLKYAAEECLDYFEANIANKWKNALGTAGAEVLKSVVGDIVDGVWQNIVKAIPGGEVALLAVKGIREVLNTGFSVDKQNAAYYQLEANVKLEDAFLRAMSHFKSNYNKNKNAYTSSVYLRSIDMFESNLLLGFDYAIDMINVIKNSGFGAFWSGSASKAIANIENSKSMKQQNINLYRDNVEKWYESYCSIKNESIIEVLVDTEAIVNSQSTITNNSNGNQQRKRIVEIAKTQLGKTNANHTYRNDDYAWCASFVVWCARQAGIDKSIIKTSGYATADDLGVEYRGRSADRKTGINYTPQSGDLIFFDWAFDGYNYKAPASAHGDHVGIVEKVENGYVTTIEGNSGGKVKSITYKLTDRNIKGYGIPKYSDEPVNSNSVNAFVDYQISKVNVKSTANKSATISVELNQKASISKWTYLLSTKKSDLANLDGTNGNTHVSTDTITCRKILNYESNPQYKKSDTFKIEEYQGKALKPNTTYYYKVTVKIGSKWYSTGVKSFTTANNLPDAAVLRVARDSQVVGIGFPVSLNWDPAQNTDTYTIQVKNEQNEIVKTIDDLDAKAISYTLDSFENSGDYTATIITENEIGSTEGSSVSFRVEPNRTVRYFDTISNEVICEESVPFGGDAHEPKVPSHYGHTFSRWSRSLQDIRDIDSVVTINAEYDRNSYTVRFIDSFTNELINIAPDQNTQSVEYEDPALAPSMERIPTHTGYSFVKWDKDYSKIERDTDVYTVYEWSDKDNIALVSNVGVTPAVKNNTTEHVGYDISATILNSSDKVLSGRLVAVLKSQGGTILTQCESGAFAVEAADEHGASVRNISFTVLYEGLAPVVELYLINGYDDLGQLAEMVSCEIDNSTVVSGWTKYYSDEDHPQIDDQNKIELDPTEYTEERKYYRVRTSERTTEVLSAADGVTLVGYEKINPVQQTLDYVTAWPSGFLRTDSLYTKYNKQPVTNSETETQVIEAGDSDVYGYIYYHWCYGTYKDGPINRWIEGSKTSKCDHFHAFFTTSAKTFNTSAKAYKSSPKNSSGNYICTDTYWWYGLKPDKEGNTVVKRQTYTVYDKEFHYVSEWSDWIEYEGDCPVIDGAPVDPSNPNKIYEVEMKTETETYKRYRLKDNTVQVEPVISDDSGRKVTITGTVSSEFAGKQATVWVYKYTQASDFTTEFVAATDIGDNGEILIENAILREAPTVSTKDYTVVISIPGVERALHIGYVAAPKPEYDVIFFDAYGNELSRQKVEEGSSAMLPTLTDIPDGYEFIGWDQSVVNVRCNLEVNPMLREKTFVVVFVDWNDQSVQLAENVEYGSCFNTPDCEESSVVVYSDPKEVEGCDTEWVVQVGDEFITLSEFNQSHVITGNTVVTTRSTPSEYTVVFLKADPDKILEEKIDSYDDPEEVLNIQVLSEESEDFEIASWKTETFGTGVDFSEVLDIEESEDIDFMGWIDAKTGLALASDEIFNNMVLYPRYVFAETVEVPEVSMDSGEYYEAIEVELTPEFETASIWYTLDGTDPKTSDTAVEYEGPISLDNSCVLTCYSGALGYNDSEVITRYYAINPTDENRQHVVTVIAVTAEGVPFTNTGITRLIDDGAYLPADMYSDEFAGFSDCTLYRFFDFYEEFDPTQDVIYDSITLYAFYEPIEYTVTFYGFYGNTLSTQKVAFGNEAEAPIAPEVYGYVFAGWDGDYSYVDGDLDVFARYITPDEYATISLDKKAVTLNVGASYANLQAIITPALHSNYDIEWYSSNEDVASVDENGVITAISVGTATIMAKLPYTGETAEVTVKVAYDLDSEIVLLQGAEIGFDSARNLRVTPSAVHTADGILAAFENADLSICKADGTELTGTALVGTGCVVKLVSGDELIDFATIVLTGDYNGDGAINNKDVVMLNQLVLDKREADLWQMIALDVNGDGYVNNKDCAMLARYLVGKESL